MKNQRKNLFAPIILCLSFAFLGLGPDAHAQLTQLHVNDSILGTSFRLNNFYPAPGGQGIEIVRIHGPNISDGSGLLMKLGHSSSFRNEADIRFDYAGSGSPDNALSFGFNSIQPFVFFTAGEMVGIGTSSPTDRLTIESSGVENTRLIGPFDFGYGARLSFGDENYVYLQEDADDALTIFADFRTTILGGNVGIHTNDPQSPLHVIASDENEFYNNGIYLYNEQDSAGRNAIISARVAGANSGDPFLSLDVNNDGGWSIGMDNDDDNKLKIGSRPDLLDAEPRMTIHPDGRVGIGTTDPSELLHIQFGNLRLDDGEIRSWGPLTFHPDVDTTGDDEIIFLNNLSQEVARINNNGFLGIGTQGPWAPLHVVAPPSVEALGIVLRNDVDSAFRNAHIYAEVAGVNGGDPFIGLNVFFEAGWSIGLDNDDDNKLKFGTDAGAVGAQTKMTIAQGGNLGISTENPSERLHVANGNVRVENGNVRVENGNVRVDDGDFETLGPLFLHPDADTSGDDEIIFLNNLRQEVGRFGANGFLGIGTNNPVAPLHVVARKGLGPFDNGLHLVNPVDSAGQDAIVLIGVGGVNAGDPYISLDVGGESGWAIGIDNDDDNKLKIGTRSDQVGGENRMTINRDGLVGIGTTTPTYQLQMSLDSAAKPLTSTWTIASDARLKDELGSFTDGSDIIRQIRPVTFRYNGIGGLPTDAIGIGTIAQELQEIAPYMVRSSRLIGENGEMQEFLTVNYHSLFFVLTNALQEQMDEVESLTAENNMQNSEVENLQEELAHLKEAIGQMRAEKESLTSEMTTLQGTIRGQNHRMASLEDKMEQLLATFALESGNPTPPAMTHSTASSVRSTDKEPSQPDAKLK